MEVTCQNISVVLGYQGWPGATVAYISECDALRISVKNDATMNADRGNTNWQTNYGVSPGAPRKVTPRHYDTQSYLKHKMSLADKASLWHMALLPCKHRLWLTPKLIGGFIRNKTSKVETSRTKKKMVTHFVCLEHKHASNLLICITKALAMCLHPSGWNHEVHLTWVEFENGLGKQHAMLKNWNNLTK